MLSITRKIGQKIVVGDHITIEVQDVIGGDKVRLGVYAPDDTYFIYDAVDSIESCEWCQSAMPPDGTSSGYHRDGSMWFACNHDGKPGIAYCQHPGNWLNPPLYSLVAVFEREADRDFVLELHRKAVTQAEKGST